MQQNRRLSEMFSNNPLTTLNQQYFLQQMNVKQIIDMFDLLPGVLFWVKDKQHKFIHANQAFIEHQTAKNLNDVIGKTDFDFSPAHIAKQFITDDLKIHAGEQVTDRLELNMTLSGDTAWFSTTKRPLFDDQGEVIGSYGMTRHLHKQAMALSAVHAIQAPVDYIRAKYAKDFTIEDLAEVAHLSVSALERRFKKHLGKTPKQFISEVRLEHARRMLIESNLPISQIGHETGFADHSYFSKQFKKTFGELPSDYRSSYVAKDKID